MKRCLDLFCGAGGAAEGYKRGGLDIVTGVDLYWQPHYPFGMLRSDALSPLIWNTIKRWNIGFIHASPPCQAYSPLQRRSHNRYPRLIEPTRELLKRTGLPYVIENVPTAPLHDPVTLCGTMFPSLRVLRHRNFEANFEIPTPNHPAHPLVFTHDKRKRHYGQLDQDTSFVQVTGGGNCTVANKASAMGIDWMTGAELNEAIPPAYTEYISQFIPTS